MSFYLVRAHLRPELREELCRSLKRGDFRGLEPFGREIDRCLKAIRVQPDGACTWEEEDYCTPPLAAERAAVLDRFFEGIRVESVKKGEGWEKIAELPRLFPELNAGNGK